MMVSKFKVIFCALSLISAGQSLAMDNEVRRTETAFREQVATALATGRSNVWRNLRRSLRESLQLGIAVSIPVIAMLELSRGNASLLGRCGTFVSRSGNLICSSLAKAVKNNPRFCLGTLAAASLFGGGVMYAKHTATKEISALKEHYKSILRQKDANVHEQEAAALVLVNQLMPMIEAQIAMVQPLIDGCDMAQPIVDVSAEVPHVDAKADDSQSISSQYSTESEEFLDKTATVYQELLPVLTDMVQGSKDKKTKEGLTHAIDLVKQLQQQVAQYHDECDPEAEYHTAECTECTRECQYRSAKGAALLAKLQECKKVLQSFKDTLQQDVSCIICRENADGELGELVALPCKENHGAHVIHQGCLQQLMQQRDHRCPMCRGALSQEGNAPVAHPDHEIVHVLAEDGNGYEEIPFPVTQQ